MPSAGDVERFVYCAHNWYLARGGVDVQDEGSRRGIATHRETGRVLQDVERVESEERQGLRWAFRLLLAAASVTLLTMQTVYFEANPQSFILLATTIVLVVASVGLLIIAFDARRRVLSLRQRHGLVPGRAGGELAGDEGILEDPAWGITGRPDYVLEGPDGPVPVEVKSGITPPRPHESHVMQVACYLRLLEAAGRPPKHGLVTYPERADRVDWDDETKRRLRAVLQRIAAAEAAGSADRDHEHPGRCRGCARRAFCDQRLA